jgi:hypothetical protein
VKDFFCVTALGDKEQKVWARSLDEKQKAVGAGTYTYKKSGI